MSRRAIHGEGDPDGQRAPQPDRFFLGVHCTGGGPLGAASPRHTIKGLKNYVFAIKVRADLRSGCMNG
jgi:hypothetical protein